jgi:transposase
MDRRKNAAHQGGAIADLPWQQWPDGLRSQARQVLAQWQAGRPGAAVDLVDELMSDLAARRATLADSANRVFEPSTDDRNL